MAADQIGHQYRQTIVLTLQPVVLDLYILALDVTGFVKAFAERGHVACGGIRRTTIENSDYRHHRLLGPRRKRPRNRCAAEKPDEIAPLHVPSVRSTPYAMLNC